MSVDAWIALALAQATPAPALPPTGKWVVEYADNMCVLSHDFGTTQEKTTLGFRPLPLGEDTEIVLLTPGTIRAA